jgi:acyl-CoA synthetase (AMP-forming)/AMP-acid ligase II
MISKSFEPTLAIPDKSLPEFVLHRARALGDKPALIEGPTGRVITYSQLADLIERTAAGLAQHGFQKGDVLAIYCPNLPDYAVVFLAVAALGGINTTINPLYTAGELANQLNDSGAKFLLTVPPLMDKVLVAAEDAGLHEIFVLGEADGATPFAALLDNEGQAPTVTINPREDLVVLPYSSGTTGLPKGVMLTHHNIVANICQIDAVEPYGQADTLIGILPFFHIYGMTVIMGTALYKGATVVTMPRFDLEQFLQLMQNYGVTWAYLAPPLVLALAKQPLVDQYNLSKLKTILSGAAPLGKDVAQACAQRLGCLVRQGYGLTESSPVTHLTPYDPAKVKPGSIGLVVPNTEYKVMDYLTGAEAGPQQEGELWVRGPQVMKGYLNRPEATAAMIDSEGWLHTGDIGYADEDGYFFVVDRLKELIKYKGLQVAPAELEAMLLTHPAVADAAVIGSPDEEAGQVPKAFVVLRTPVAAEEIMTYVAQRVAPHKKVRRLEIIDQIPKSPSGKILRRLLVERDRAVGVA